MFSKTNKKEDVNIQNVIELQTPNELENRQQKLVNPIKNDTDSNSDELQVMEAKKSIPLPESENRLKLLLSKGFIITFILFTIRFLDIFYLNAKIKKIGKQYYIYSTNNI